jgi:hypothetical protein
MPDEIIIGSGKTKITAAVAGRSCSWQQDIWQVIKPAWLAWLHSIGACSCAADWALAAPSVPACPCARHIVPLQQVIPLACHATAHTGAHSKIAATRHTQAPRSLPGAIGMWPCFFMWLNAYYSKILASATFMGYPGYPTLFRGLNGLRGRLLIFPDLVLVPSQIPAMTRIHFLS